MDVDSPKKPRNPHNDNQNLPQGMAVPNHDNHPPSTQPNTQEQPDHTGRTRKRKNPHANGPQTKLHCPWHGPPQPGPLAEPNPGHAKPEDHGRQPSRSSLALESPLPT
eukprot:1149785-Pelagomonas_calceolata.AAC.1